MQLSSSERTPAVRLLYCCIKMRVSEIRFDRALSIERIRADPVSTVRMDRNYPDCFLTDITPHPSTVLLQIALEAFGKRFELELNRNLNLVPEQRRLNVFFADRGKENIHYEPNTQEVSSQQYIAI